MHKVICKGYVTFLKILFSFAGVQWTRFVIN